MIYKPSTNTVFEEHLSSERAINVQSRLQQIKVNPVEMHSSVPEYQRVNPFQKSYRRDFKNKIILKTIKISLPPWVKILLPWFAAASHVTLPLRAYYKHITLGHST